MTRTALYRHYDADGVLLYVGASANPSPQRPVRRHSPAALRTCARGLRLSRALSGVGE